VACFHCGLPVPQGSLYRIEVDGAWRSLCCPGCETLARVIVGQGLEGYYRLRDSVPARSGAGDSGDSFKPDLSLYDEPTLQSRLFAMSMDSPKPNCCSRASIAPPASG